MTSARLKANGMLLITAIIWGGAFVAQRAGMQSLGPFTFNGLRFALGTITLLPIFLWRRGRHQKDDVDFQRTVLIGGAAGLLLFVGATFQQLGLVYTTAGRAGFVTGLYVIIVPLLGMSWGDRAPLQSWAGAVLAVVGFYFLSVKEQGTMALGDAFVLVGAFFWAGHVQFIAHFSSLVRPMRLSCVQSLVTALLSFLVGIVWEDTTWRMVVDAAGPILYGGVISIGFAYTLQIIAQQDARPTHAAIILSLESVFAALWGWLFLGEVLSIRGGFGAGLMLSGMILAQVQFARQREEREWELHP